MLFYEICYTYHYENELSGEETGRKGRDQDPEEMFREKIVMINRQLYDRRPEDRCSFVYRADENGLSAAFISKTADLSSAAVSKGTEQSDASVSVPAAWSAVSETEAAGASIVTEAEGSGQDSGIIGAIEDLIREMLKLQEIKCISLKEITIREFSADLDICFDMGLSVTRRRFHPELNLDLDSSEFRLEEVLIDDRVLSRADAEREAQAIMADESLLEELDRIYSEENAEAFYGYPVHYHIRAGNPESAQDIVMLLVRALYSKKRIPGRRISRVTNIGSGCYADSAMENLMKHSGFCAVTLEMKGDSNESEYVTEYERVVSYLAKKIISNHQDTLFFLIEDTKEEGFTRSLMAKLSNRLDIMTIREGRGDPEEARAYLQRLIRGSRYAPLEEDSVYRRLSDRNSFQAGDVHRVFDGWKRHCLKESAYRAYHGFRCPEKKTKHKKTKAYDRLMGMTGLAEVKDLTDQIIAYYRIRKLREHYDLGDGNLSRHMIFTGNPGCAKTTVARLLAEVLAEEHIIESGAFVECGRANLVGKYVGWTARQVIQRFNEAKGGILFIDEAYSLLEDHHSYGDEAINTIVQEMENRRNDVIVIFAGYPEPMEAFIGRNEGLRSRIAFHVDFRDYDADELTGILLGMAKEQGFTVEEAAIEKCRGIFYNVCRQKDFGNGRFVRNLFEKALMEQSLRLSREKTGAKRTKKELSLLRAGDFPEDPVIRATSGKTRTIGFV